MRESFLKLNDRTVVLAGPLNQISSTAVTVMSERGCDVGIVTHSKVNEIQRFCENINDAREVHHNYGRAACIASELNSKEEASDAISRVAEAFGSIDIVLDMHLLDLTANSDSLEARVGKTLNVCSAAMPFLEGRNKGRIIYLTNELVSLKTDVLEKIKTLSSEFLETVGKDNITMNGISTGLTEELLLALYDGKKSIQEALSEYEKDNGPQRLIEPTEVASIISFLSSPISSAISGQLLRANAGLQTSN